MLNAHLKKAVCLAFVASALIVGCTAGAPQGIARQMPKGPDAVWHLVVIGDGSLWGLANAFAQQIEKDVGVKVVPEDWAIANLRAGTVLQLLQTGETPSSASGGLPDALKDADVVVMSVVPQGSVVPEKPLDLNGCFYASAPKSCGPETFEKWTSDLETIWGEILRLRAGSPTILRAMDRYNPLVAPWKQNGVFEACTQCWVNMSDAARKAAAAYNIPFLSLLDAFDGPNHDEDPRLKGYIGSDGIHPSDAGTQYIAELLSKMGYEPVTPP